MDSDTSQLNADERAPQGAAVAVGVPADRRPAQRPAATSLRDHPCENSPDARARSLWDENWLADPHSQADKAARVRQMFDDIAPTYERVNTLASAGRDRGWRRETVRLAEIKPADRVLDIACGTGDLTEAFARAGARRIVGIDFASQMLLRSLDRAPGRAGWIQGDALRLPFADETFDITCCAFGVRNFQHLEAGLGEMHRVLRPGGRAVILEFSMPTQPILRGIYQFYFAKILPKLATWISGDRTGAYNYLPSSVQTFVTPPQLIEILKKVGFSSARATSRTCGIVHMVRAEKATSE